jgi:rSAM/selenodomain-associated transferase 2
VKLSVVIPALDEADRIAEAIGSAMGEGVEVIVVDGGSRDGTRERAAAAGATVLQAKPGRARQLGIGARRARGDAVLFLHADTRLPDGWSAAVSAALADPTISGGAFGLRFDVARPALRVIQAGVALRVKLFGLPYGDQAIFARRSALEEVGGVPDAPLMEDLDLVRALKRCGRFAMLPLSVTTSARSYLERGPWRVASRNLLAAAAWAIGLDRARVAAWYRG